MSLTADVAIGAAERIERVAGSGAALTVYRRLASTTDASELRARAILGGLRCAIAQRDLGAMRDLSQLWATVDAGAWDEVFATCKAMWRAGLGVPATELAYAEVKRFPTAKALYAYARALDVAGDSRAGEAFGEAVAKAEKEGAPALLRSARVRRASWLARAAETLPAAIEEARRVLPAEVTPAERIELARVLLRSPSRFVRAGALGLLDELASGGGAIGAIDATGAADTTTTAGAPRGLAARALRLAALHADEMGDALTPLEVDRLLALLGRERLAASCGPARDAVRALDRLARSKAASPSATATGAGAAGADAELAAALDEAARGVPELAALHRRARDILAGRFEAHQAEGEPATSAAAAPAGSPWAPWTPMLDAVAAMRDAAWPRAARSLRALSELAESGRALPPQAYTIAQVALGVDDAEVRGVAGRLVDAMMRTTSAAPPRGWLALATALTACGMDELAARPRRAAALAKEPGGEQALGLALTRKAWQLAHAGERSRAIAALREAKALAPAPPDAPAPAPGPGDPLR